MPGVVRHDWIARSCVNAGRTARERQTGQEPVAPRGAVIRRDSEADVRRAPVEPSADLERGDGRSAEREAVRLGLCFVLRVCRSVGIAREPPADELAVASDCVREIRVHHIHPWSAAHVVACSVVRGRDQVVAWPSVVQVAARPSQEEVGAAHTEELIAPCETADVVRAGGSDQPVVPRGAGDAARSRHSRAEEQTDQDERDDAHHVSRTRAVTPGLHVADYDPVS